MIHQAYKNFIEEAELFFVNKFIDSESIKEMYSDCLDIIFDITKTKDSTRGIIAQNEKYGQGKSFFFDVVNHRNRRKKGKYAFKRTTARELCDIYTSTKKGQDPQEAINEFINVKNLFIDDIGDELKDGKERSNYSNRLNVLRYVLLKRYDQWMEKGWKLFGTTNLTIDAFAKNYDGRVADRIQQMTYWKEFKFLNKGSFRQLSSTRKLTQDEIQASWYSFMEPEKEEKVDLEKYFNELIKEEDDYFADKSFSFWHFVREYLEEQKLLTDEDYRLITEAEIEAAGMLLRRESRDIEARKLKHAPGNVRSNAIDKVLGEIKRKEKVNTAELIVAKNKFMELRNSKHIFS